jgi:hypothetical protein
LDGKFSWNSGEKFGQTENSYETKKKKDEIYSKFGLSPTVRVYIHGRIIIKDLHGDGLNEVIVSKPNVSMGISQKTRTFESGEVYSLVWNGKEIVVDWKTREIKGYIADYQIKDVDNDGEEELVVAVVNSPGEGGTWGVAKDINSHILFLKLF